MRGNHAGDRNPRARCADYLAAHYVRVLRPRICRWIFVLAARAIFDLRPQEPYPIAANPKLLHMAAILSFSGDVLSSLGAPSLKSCSAFASEIVG